MVDMTKCTNDDCPASGYCYRQTAPAAPEYQAYGRFEPDDGAVPFRCMYYIRDKREVHATLAAK